MLKYKPVLLDSKLDDGPSVTTIEFRDTEMALAVALMKARGNLPAINQDQQITVHLTTGSSKAEVVRLR